MSSISHRAYRPAGVPFFVWRAALAVISTSLGFLPSLSGATAAELSPGSARETEAAPQPFPPASSPPRSVRIGERAPTLHLKGVDGNGIELSSTFIATKRPFVVVFFATWCQPCHRAIDDLFASRVDVSGADATPQINVVLVDYGESTAVVRRWAATAHLPSDVTLAMDPEATNARSWGVRRLPTTFIVDGGGVVRHINRGWGTGYRDRVSRWLRALSVSTVVPGP